MRSLPIQRSLVECARLMANVMYNTFLIISILFSLSQFTYAGGVEHFISFTKNHNVEDIFDNSGNIINISLYSEYNKTYKNIPYGSILREKVNYDIETPELNFIYQNYNQQINYLGYKEFIYELNRWKSYGTTALLIKHEGIVKWNKRNKNKIPINILKQDLISTFINEKECVKIEVKRLYNKLNLKSQKILLYEYDSLIGFLKKSKYDEALKFIEQILNSYKKYNGDDQKLKSKRSVILIIWPAYKSIIKIFNPNT